MSRMRYTPKGYGGRRRDPEQVKRDGWHEQRMLAVSLNDQRLTWPEKELVRQLGDKLLSYDFPRLPRQKGATARHAIYGGQWRGSDREKLGRFKRRAVVGSPPSSSSVLNGYPGSRPG